MGIISRTDYVPGDDITAELQNTNENVIVTEFNGSIDNANIKDTAGIVGTKIAASPIGIPTDRINDSAVTTAKIADDAVTSAKLQDDAAVDANRAVTTNHIKDLAVATAKIADAAITAIKVAADAIIAAKVKTTTYNWVPGGTLTTNTPISINTTLGNTVKPLSFYSESTTAIITDVLDPAAGLINLMVWWNTTTSTWYLTVATFGGNLSLTGITFKLLYITAS